MARTPAKILKLIHASSTGEVDAALRRTKMFALVRDLAARAHADLFTGFSNSTPVLFQRSSRGLPPLSAAPFTIVMSRNPKSSPDPSSAEARGALGEWGKHAGFGIQYAVTIGIFAFGGFKFDEWLGTEPFGLLIAVFGGFIGATVSLVKKLPSGGSSSSSSSSTASKSKSDPDDPSQ